MIKTAIDLLVQGKSLTMEQAAGAMEQIMGGEATPAQFGAFVTALRIKGETVDEIAGLAQVMRDKATRVDVEPPVVDTCGTGGDNSGSFNISTAAAFVVAGAGLKVAKHGNRAMTSHSGSADVLEALGVKIDLGPDDVRRCLDEVGIGFMFAQVFHPAMKYAAAPRREIGIRTVFNILGPLTNPAGATAQVVGVADGALTMKIAQVLQRLGSCHALVVHGEDGLDEMSLSAKTVVCELKKGLIFAYSVAPEDVGLIRVPKKNIAGASAAENAEAMQRLFCGQESPYRDIVLLNAAAALLAGDVADGLKEGLEGARESIDTGKAARKLRNLVEMSRSLG